MIRTIPLPERDFTWIDVQDPNEADFERLSDEFHLPYLLVQDCLRPEHLPKYEFTGGAHFLMMRSFDEHAESDANSIQDLTRKVALFITEKQVITIHRIELDYLDNMRERFKSHHLPQTIQGVVHQLILSVIKSYEDPIEKLQDEYESFEDVIFSKSADSLSTLQSYQFKRKISVFKKMLKQTNDSLSRFRDFWSTYPSMLQDLKENIDQHYFALDEISESFDHLFQLHISMADQRANQVMKVLTVFSTILLPLNFLASFYGMNFDFLPGLHSHFAFVLLCTMMGLTCLVGVIYFRSKGWFRTYKQ